jgi:hypothetical protein
MKTKMPIGNLQHDTLIEILDSLANDPAFQAISAGTPDRMGLADGWSVEKFRAKSATTTPTGKPYANLCIGCDRFHEEVLAPRIAAAAERRRIARLAAAQ